MRALSTVDPPKTNRPNGKSAVDKTTNGKSAVDGSDWFSEMARALLPDKPGTALWALTGYDERLCQRYAAGHVKPSAFFLRKLLRSEQGWTFFAVLMDGCESNWWIELQRAKRVGEAALMEITRRE